MTTILILTIAATALLIGGFLLGYKYREIDERQTKKQKEYESILKKKSEGYKPKPNCECENISDCTGFGSTGCLLR